MVKINARRKPHAQFVAALQTEQLRGIAAELQFLRGHPPLTKRSDGKYEGHILGFVRGLRISAKVIYFLRQLLSTTNLEVSWGHIVDKNEQSCSRECDVIIHTKGSLQKWNGGESPIMEFKFVEVGSVRAVVSCKAELRSIDKNYPSELKEYGVSEVLLFAECCEERRLSALRDRAKRYGYRGVWVAYQKIGSNGEFSIDDGMHFEFAEQIRQAVKA